MAKLNEKSVSKAQQKAAGAALAAKKSGDTSKLKGASKEMAKMSKGDLEDFAKTKHKGLPEKKIKEAKKEKSAVDKIRKPTAPPTKAHADKNKYNRKVKHKKDISVDEACKKKKSTKESKTMKFKDMIKLVIESGGQQQIDPVDEELFAWATRVAKSKYNESQKQEVYAGMLYERNGGEFNLYDVLSEDK